MTVETGPIIVFDAVCVLCSSHAQLVLRHDRRRHFRLASMQSEAGQALYRRFGIDPNNPETLILVDGDRVLRDSDAVLEIWKRLGGVWRSSGLFRAVPRSVRDPIYRWIARNRYRLFGKLETCWVPAPADRGRIL